MNTDYSDITVELSDGRRAYLPKELQVLRLAPTCLCQLYSRIKNLRAHLQNLAAQGVDPSIIKSFDSFITQLPLEERINSGKMVEIHDAIMEICVDGPGELS